MISVDAAAIVNAINQLGLLIIILCGISLWDLEGEVKT
jgi:hypothetical protein